MRPATAALARARPAGSMAVCLSPPLVWGGWQSSRSPGGGLSPGAEARMRGRCTGYGEARPAPCVRSGPPAPLPSGDRPGSGWGRPHRGVSAIPPVPLRRAGCFAPRRRGYAPLRPGRRAGDRGIEARVRRARRSSVPPRFPPPFRRACPAQLRSTRMGNSRGAGESPSWRVGDPCRRPRMPRAALVAGRRWRSASSSLAGGAQAGRSSCVVA